MTVLCAGSKNGVALVLVSSLVFAIANALGSQSLQAGGSVCSLLLVRGTLGWAFNGALAAANGEQLAAVMVFRGLGHGQVCLLFAIGALNSITVLCLFVAIQLYVSFADCFAILIGIYTASTMALSRGLLGRAERATLTEVIGGLFTLGGVTLVTQPSWLFAAVGASPVEPIGVVLCVVGGVTVGAYNVGCRFFSRGGLSASTVNSASLLSLGTLALAVVAVAGVASGSGGSGAPPAWARIELSHQPWAAYALLCAYCVTITSAQLIFIRGVKTVRATTAAVLGATEILFATLIGVGVLGQPTSALAVSGMLTVFVGAALVAQGASRGTRTPPEGGVESTGVDEERVGGDQAVRDLARAGAGAGMDAEAAAEDEPAEFARPDVACEGSRSVLGRYKAQHTWLKGQR